MSPRKQPQKEKGHPRQIKQKSISEHPGETSPLARVDPPELLAAPVVHVEGVFAFEEEGDSVPGGVGEVEALTLAEAGAVVEMPAVAVKAGFVEAVAEFLVGDGAAGR